MDEIIVIRAADPDGSVFQAVMDVLNGKRAEVVSIAAPVAPVLRIRELEIYHKHRRVFMAGKEVHLNHGEYTMLYCMASSPGQVFSKAQLYEAAWGEEYLHGTNSVENTIWRLRRKLEEEPRHPAYIKTVVGMDYKIDIDGEEQEIKNGISQMADAEAEGCSGHPAYVKTAARITITGSAPGCARLLQPGADFS